MFVIAVVATVIMGMRVYAWPAVAVDSETATNQDGGSTYTGARVEYKSINPDNFTAQDLKDFTEALSTADYSTSEIRTGKDYQIVRYTLKNDYAVEIVTRTDNDTMAEINKNNNANKDAKTNAASDSADDTGTGQMLYKQVMTDIVYVNAKSEEIADINLVAHFGYDNNKQVGIDNYTASVNSLIQALNFSNITLTGGNPGTNCDVYITPDLQINGADVKGLNNLVLQISCTKKGFATSQIIPLTKALVNAKYTDSLKNAPYDPLDFSSGHSPDKEVLLSKDDFVNVFDSIAPVLPSEVKMSVNKSDLTAIDSKYQKIDLKNGYYLELRLQIFKYNQDINNLSNTVSFAVKNSKNALADSFAGSMSMDSKWDGKKFSCSPQFLNVGSSAKDFIVFSVSPVTMSKDNSSAARILTIGSSLTKTVFNIELTCDKNGSMTVRITK